MDNTSLQSFLKDAEIPLVVVAFALAFASSSISVCSCNDNLKELVVESARPLGKVRTLTSVAESAKDLPDVDNGPTISSSEVRV